MRLLGFSLDDWALHSTTGPCTRRLGLCTLHPATWLSKGDRAFIRLHTGLSPGYGSYAHPKANRANTLQTNMHNVPYPIEIPATKPVHGMALLGNPCFQYKMDMAASLWRIV